jgi:hypothetical protein
VRYSTDAFRLSANETPDGTSNPWRRCSRGMRYVSVRMTKYPPDQFAGIVCDKGTD